MDAKSSLPSRFEIRPLRTEHLEWACAIVMHSNLFHSPVWPVLYPEEKTARLYECFKTGTYLIEHQINSGLSLGVFDKEYKFKREESAATSGRLYWDTTDTSVDGPELLEQMDFPLVSVAMALDSFNGLDYSKLGGLMGALPMFASVYSTLGARDQRDPESWQAKGPGEVIFRNATSTRHEYEGQGIMKALAHHMMRTAAAQGFRGIQIECLADAVTYVWSNPPAPYKGEVVSEFHTTTLEDKDENGTVSLPWKPVDQRATKVYCTLQ